MLAAVIDCHNSVCDCRTASSNDNNDHQQLDVITNFANFNSFTSSPKTILTILSNRQFKQMFGQANKCKT